MLSTMPDFYWVSMMAYTLVVYALLRCVGGWPVAAALLSVVLTLGFAALLPWMHGGWL